jgi:tRNA uridine 5-carboxymethylaminomethyl modification enzyme
MLPESLCNENAVEELTTVITDFKYEGYLDTQENLSARMAKAAQRNIPAAIQYAQLPGLSNEMVERLSRVRPQTIGQAMRIPGITPAAISLLTIHVELMSRQTAQQ